MFSQWLNTHRLCKRLAKALIRLRERAGLSEALLVAHTTLLEIPCHGSYVILFKYSRPDIIWASRRENMTIDQPVNPRSLISACVIRSLATLIVKLYTFEIAISL